MLPIMTRGRRIERDAFTGIYAFVTRHCQDSSLCPAVQLIFSSGEGTEYELSRILLTDRRNQPFGAEYLSTLFVSI